MGRVQLTAGTDAVHCLRLSSKVFRWYTDCCRTPIGNTAGPRFPVVGLIHSFMSHQADGHSREEVLGPPLCRIYERSAIGPCLLWVISGHVGVHEKASALPLKADILRGAGIVSYVPKADSGLQARLYGIAKLTFAFVSLVSLSQVVQTDSHFTAEREGQSGGKTHVESSKLDVLFDVVTSAGIRRAWQEVLPQPEPPFKGKIGRTAKDSTPDFPKGVEAPQGAPNVLVILTDDVGFGASSTFGGPIQTPNFQRLADQGLRYNEFHTTALCSPTRAALITGRNHHTNASGVITEMATGYPGYNSLVPKSSGSVGEVLKENGYNTAWFGKMHNVPDWMSSQAGPFDLWPSGLGFEYFYGFIVEIPTNGIRRSMRTRRRLSLTLDIPTTSSTMIWRTRRLPGCGCSTHSRRLSHGSSTMRRAPRTRRITHRKNGSRSSRGNLTRDGTRCGRKRLPAR
jgi:Sulfatase/Family of unknown function (DUF6151)